MQTPTLSKAGEGAAPLPPTVFSAQCLPSNYQICIKIIARKERRKKKPGWARLPLAPSPRLPAPLSARDTPIGQIPVKRARAWVEDDRPAPVPSPGPAAPPLLWHTGHKLGKDSCRCPLASEVLGTETSALASGGPRLRRRGGGPVCLRRLPRCFGRAPLSPRKRHERPHSDRQRTVFLALSRSVVPPR